MAGMQFFCQLYQVSPDDKEDIYKAFCNHYPCPAAYDDDDVVNLIERAVCDDEDAFTEYVVGEVNPLVLEESRQEKLAFFAAEEIPYDVFLRKYLDDAVQNLLRKLEWDTYNMDVWTAEKVTPLFLPHGEPSYENMEGYNDDELCMFVLEAMADAIYTKKEERARKRSKA